MVGLIKHRQKARNYSRGFHSPQRTECANTCMCFRKETKEISFIVFTEFDIFWKGSSIENSHVYGRVWPIEIG